jgi:hypothetical protein
LEQASNNKATLQALMDLVLAIVEVLEAPTDTQRAKAMRKLAATKWGWKETLAQTRQERATGRVGLGRYVGDGQEAKAAVEATVRRWEAYAESRRELGRLSLKAYEALEADDSRVTDGHQCCGGKPDCGCRSVGG